MSGFGGGMGGGSYYSMIGGGIATTISAGARIVNGYIARREHEKYAKLLEKQKMTVPGSIYDAENIYRSLASDGLPGKETMQANIEGYLPEVVNASKEVVDSPSALMDALTKASTNVNNNLRNLEVSDANAKVQNQGLLANFLSSVKSPIEMNIENFEIQKSLAAARERMLGKRELVQGYTSFNDIMTNYFAGLNGQQSAVGNNMQQTYTSPGMDANYKKQSGSVMPDNVGNWGGQDSTGYSFG